MMKNNSPGSSSMRGSLSSRSSEGQELMQWPFRSGMVLGWLPKYFLRLQKSQKNKTKQNTKLFRSGGQITPNHIPVYLNRSSATCRCEMHKSEIATALSVFFLGSESKFRVAHSSKFGMTCKNDMEKPTGNFRYQTEGWKLPLKVSTKSLLHDCNYYNKPTSLMTCQRKEAPKNKQTATGLSGESEHLLTQGCITI